MTLMKKFATLLSVVALMSVSFYVTAQEEEQEIPYFDSSVSFGFLGTTGNTQTRSFNTEFLASYYTENWTHNGRFQALGSSQDGQNQSERYYLEEKSDYNLSDFHYLYAKFTYTDDRFSGFDYQTDLSGGYGRDLITRDTFQLEGFAGIGYRESDIADGGLEDEFFITIAERLSWDISDTSNLYQALTVDYGDIRTVTKFEIGLEALIIDKLSTKIAFEIRNNSEVPADKENTDTQTSVSLVYSF